MLGVTGCRRHALPPCLPFHLVIFFCIWFRHRALHVTLPRAQKMKSRILVWGAAAHDAAFTFETQETPTLLAAATRADCPLPAALRRDPSTNATPGGTWDRELQLGEGGRERELQLGEGGRERRLQLGEGGGERELQLGEGGRERELQLGEGGREREREDRKSVV